MSQGDTFDPSPLLYAIMQSGHQCIVYGDSFILDKGKKFKTAIKFEEDKRQDVNVELGSSYIINPRSLSATFKPNIIKANARDFYLWEKEGVYLPATNDHKSMNAVDFDIRGDILDIVGSHMTPMSNSTCRIFLMLVDSDIFCVSKSKFGKTLVEDMGIKVNQQIIECVPPPPLELRQTAKHDIEDYICSAYRLLKLKQENWGSFVNAAWTRERMEYSFAGKIILADNKIAELVSTGALCVRPEGNQLVVVRST